MPKMHRNEIDLRIEGVVQSINHQFPEFATLSIAPVPSAGTVNAIFSLGEALCIRIPRTENGIKQLTKELRWLPEFQGKLPLQIPKPVKVGKANEHIPWVWAIYEWIEGENATTKNLDDLSQSALVLADFIQSLQHIDSSNGPEPGAHNFFRGEVLINRYYATKTAIAKLKDHMDSETGIKIWEEALKSAVEKDDITWIHGDIQAENILARNGQLSAIIDFGGLGVGDKACDLMPAWNFFGSKERSTFRNRLDVPDRLWIRGMGWSLSVAVIALEYYMDSNPRLAEISRYTIEQVMNDYL